MTFATASQAQTRALRDQAKRLVKLLDKAAEGQKNTAFSGAAVTAIDTQVTALQTAATAFVTGAGG